MAKSDGQSSCASARSWSIDPWDGNQGQNRAKPQADSSGLLILRPPTSFRMTALSNFVPLPDGEGPLVLDSGDHKKQKQVKSLSIKFSQGGIEINDLLWKTPSLFTKCLQYRWGPYIYICISSNWVVHFRYGSSLKISRLAPLETYSRHLRTFWNLWIHVDWFYW